MRSIRVVLPLAVLSVGAAFFWAAPASSQPPTSDECGEITDTPGSPDVPIIGTEGPDTLAGTPGDDIIYGLGGRDIICGRGGNDTIFGGDDNDLLSGGPGADRIEGGDGADRIEGNGGADQLLGGQGADVIAGGAGDDRIRGGSQGDSLRGGKGSDWLIGGGGRDTLLGQGGPDQLAGSSGNDSLRGGGSYDVLKGGQGSDSLRGGRGRDQLFGNAGLDDLFGGSGRDTCKGGAGVDSQRDCELRKLRRPTGLTVTPGVCSRSLLGDVCNVSVAVRNHERGRYVRPADAAANALPPSGDTFVSVFHAVCDPSTRPNPQYPRDPYVEKWWNTGFESDAPDPEGFRSRCLGVVRWPSYFNVGVDGAPVGRLDWEVAVGPGDWCAWTFAEKGVHGSKLDDRNVWTREDVLLAYSDYSEPVCFSLTDELEFIPGQDFGEDGEDGR